MRCDVLNNVVGGLKLDVLFRTIRDYGLERFGLPAVPDPSSKRLLENALSCRRDLYNQSGSIDNIDKAFRDLFNNPLASLVWKVATFRFWSGGYQESDKDTQIVSFEDEVQRFF